MRLLRLRLLSFRAHAETEVELAPRINLFIGPNGAGKTNLLEALHYLSLGKSFLTSTDSHALRRGESFFEIEGAFEGERRSSLTIRLAYAGDAGKRAFVNGSPLPRLAELIGMAPLVVLSPADHELTAGGPSERRRFLDQTLSQAYPVYLDDLLKYRRALKQRNALLMQVRRGAPMAPGTMEAWSEELSMLGARIVGRRRAFLARFSAFLDQAYALLDAASEEPSAAYAPSAAADAEPGDEVDTEADAAALRRAFSRAARRERDLGRTLAGPHLDEVAFRLDGFDVRPYASQGQHRTLGLALRIATALFLHDRLDEPPLLLLDDVFGALDVRRTRAVLDLLTSDAVGQSLVTAARSEPFEGLDVGADSEHRSFSVVHGSVEPAPALPSPT